jgi:ferric-dicitrate binding protein FerR (iron transport regulator)
MADVKPPRRTGGPDEPGPPASTDELWTALADAQDAALARAARDQARVHALENAVAARVLAHPATPARARRRRSGAWLVACGALGAAGVAGALLLVLFPRAPGLSFQLGDGRVAGAPGRTLVAEAESELPLRFSDGSSVTFQPGSAGRVDRLTGRGAEVVLERGRLDAAVQHAPDTRWLVRAGPFRVRVTGTRFEVDWQPPAGSGGGDGRLTVALREGSVIVDGGLLGDGIPLRAGQRLRVEPGPGGEGLVRTDSLVAVPAVAVPSAATPVPAPAAATPPARDEVLPAKPRAAAAGVSSAGRADDWRVLAEQGAYAEALRAAERVGLPALTRRLGVRDLLALGDVARYAGAPAQARGVFEQLVRRYPGEPAAADAVFSLGRLAFEAERPAEAAHWFERYLRDWPAGPLAVQAAARLAEARDR